MVQGELGGFNLREFGEDKGLRNSSHSSFWVEENVQRGESQISILTFV